MNRLKFIASNLIVILVIFADNQKAQRISPKIIGGYNVSTIDGFKHQVSIRDASHEKSLFGSGHICGGSLIDYDTVLTAAHCVHDGYKYLRPNYYIVVMGNLDLFTRSRNTVVRTIAKIIGHAKYDPETFVNDIALMKLTKSVPVDHPTAQPIMLSSYEAIIGQKCVASGWGSIEFQENARAVRWLMAVNISVNARSKCNRVTSHAGSVIRGQFCAGSFDGGQDTCQGDSGGPFTCGNVLVGITSHGFECGLPNYPGIYMDVGYYRDWIAAANSGVDFFSNRLFYCTLVLVLMVIK